MATVKIYSDSGWKCSHMIFGWLFSYILSKIESHEDLSEKISDALMYGHLDISSFSEREIQLIRNQTFDFRKQFSRDDVNGYYPEENYQRFRKIKKLISLFIDLLDEKLTSFK